MSSRQNFFRYGGAEDGNDFLASLGLGAIFPMISEIAGKNNITGGFSQSPDGKVQFQPYQGSSGFLGKRSQREAAARNDAYFANKQQQDADLQTRLEEQKLRNQGQLDNTKLQGENAFYLQNQADITADERAAKDRAHAEQMTRLATMVKMLSDAGILPDETGQNKYRQQLEDPSIALRRQTLANDTTLGGMRGNALQSPGMQDALTSGMAAEFQAPVYNNLNRGTIPIPGNSAVLFPSNLGLNLGMAQGPQIGEDVSTDEFGKATVRRTVKPPILPRTKPIEEESTTETAPPPAKVQPTTAAPSIGATKPIGRNIYQEELESQVGKAKLPSFYDAVKGQLSIEQLNQLINLGILK